MSFEPTIKEKCRRLGSASRPASPRPDHKPLNKNRVITTLNQLILNSENCFIFCSGEEIIPNFRRSNNILIFMKTIGLDKPVSDPKKRII